MGLLDGGLPDTVRIRGEEVAIWTGFREALRFMSLDMGDLTDRLAALVLWYGEPEEWPDVVADAPDEAVAAASEFVGGAWSAVSYGTGNGGGGRRLFDWDADAGIIAADFQRLYGLDLFDPGTQLHWWRFVALFVGAIRTDGSLVSQAVYARSDKAPTKSKEERERRAKLREAWRLPPTEEELRAKALAEFGG